MKNFLAYFITFAWIIGISGAISQLHAWHQVDLSPKGAQIDVSNLFAPTNTYGAVHFLTPMCSCSTVIFDHLLERKPISSITETVVVIDDNQKNYVSLLKDAGYKVIKTTKEELARKYHNALKGVPLLAIYDKESTIQYLGGYSSKTITPFSKIDISKFIEDLDNKKSIASYPVKGCSVSKSYQQLLDPLGIKYAKR